MLGEKATKTVEACRFCCMCRHLCPLGLALGKELNNPRAKALLLSMQSRGAIQESIYAEDMYECCLCNACASNCETGYEPAVFIREVRAHLVANELAPSSVLKAIDGLLTNGTLCGVTAEASAAPYVEEKTNGTDVLLYIGSAAAVKTPQMVSAVKELLKKAGVGFTVFAQNLSTGASEYDLMGEVQEVKDIARKCADALSAYQIGTVVALNPTDARMMKQQFSDWGFAVPWDVQTATAFFAGLIAEGKLHVIPSGGVVTYHDPCRLARDLQETEPARDIISAMGYTLKEMWQSKALTRCCGGEVLASYAPELVSKAAEARMVDITGTGAEAVVCACPCCEENLSRTRGAEIKDIFVLLNAHCA